MKQIVKFTPMNDIVRRVNLKPVVMFSTGTVYSGIRKPKQKILAYTDKHMYPILIKSSEVIFE